MRFDRGLHAAGRKPRPRRRRFNQKPFDIYIEHRAQFKTEQVSISFSMKNMDMGFNRYMFERQPSGTWQAVRIRLPICVEAQARFYGGHYNRQSDISDGIYRRINLSIRHCRNIRPERTRYEYFIYTFRHLPARLGDRFISRTRKPRLYRCTSV